MQVKESVTFIRACSSCHAFQTVEDKFDTHSESELRSTVTDRGRPSEEIYFFSERTTLDALQLQLSGVFTIVMSLMVIAE